MTERDRFGAAVAAICFATIVLGLLIAPGGRGAAPSDTGTVAGAPRPSHGHFVHYRWVCPVAAVNRYLPARAGCVSVFHADVDGGGRSDLVLLFATLGSRRLGPDYEPTGWELEVVGRSGARTGIRVAGPRDRPFLVRIGNVNRVPGDELLIQPTEVSSGSPETMYTLVAGRLRRVVGLSAGGDSADRERFSCQRGADAGIVQQVAVLLGPTIHGRWRWTTTIYRWHGARLVKIATRTTVKRGLPRIGRRAFGAGCGRLVGQTGDE